MFLRVSLGEKAPGPMADAPASGVDYPLMHAPLVVTDLAGRRRALRWPFTMPPRPRRPSSRRAA